MKIEVGKFYFTEDGRIIKILKEDGGYFLDKDDYFYSENGENDKIDTSRNVIAEIPKELHRHLNKEVMNYWQDEDFRDAVNNVYGGEK